MPMFNARLLRPSLCAATLATAIATQAPCGTPHLVGMPHPANATSTRLYDVVAFAPNDVWTVGQRHRDISGQLNSFAWILHWDGAHFVDIPCPSPGIPNLRTWCELRAVGGSGPNDVWAAGVYERQFPNNGHIGPQMFFLHWDGSSWTQVPEPLPQFTYMASASGTRIDEIIAHASNDVWFFGWWPGDQFSSAGPLTVHWNGSNLVVENVAPLPNSNSQWRWVDVDSLPGNDFWGVASVGSGNYGTYVGRRSSGGNWAIQTIPTLPITYYQHFGICAISNNDVWVSGSEQRLNPSTPIAPYTIHWNGSSWTRRPTAGYIRDFVAFASNDVWAFGTTIEHWNGTAWTLVMSYGPTLQSAQSWEATAAGPCDLWTVGTQWTSTSPPVVALAAHLGAANAGNTTLRLPCTTPALRQSLLSLSLPRIGQVLRAQADDALGTAGLAGSLLTAWVFAFGAGPFAPCGAVVPGLGQNGGALEVLVDATATIAAFATWAPGQPAEFAVSMPNNPAIVGLPLVTQAVFFTPSGLLGTSALDLVIGQ